MDDYISRQKLLKDIEQYHLSDGKFQYWVEVQPSADVQPVRHGHWIHDGLDTPHGVDWMHCSECGNRDVYCPAAMTDYCPNCGARMDGEQNDDVGHIE